MSAHEAADAGNFLLVTSTAILFITYALIISERINRSVIALLGAGFTIALGVLNQEQAIAAIDFNTLGLLAGMMMIVGVSKKSGLFGYVAIRAAQIVRGSPAGIMMAFVIVTAMFSALLDNVTTVLLLVPVTFVVCGELKLPVYPFLFTEIFAGNIGGTATLIGDPPNILIGSAAGLNFNDFVVALAPVVLIILVLQMIANHLIWGIKLKASAEERARVMSLNAREMIVDKYLLVCSLGVISMVMLAFTTAHFIKLEAATIAMFGAAILLLLESFVHKPHKHSELVTHAFHEVEWITLFFFVGLFIVIGGVEHAGLLNMAANKLLSVTGGNLEIMTYGILWTSAILSAIVDNIPFVATMIPLINSVAPVMGGEHVIMPLWWALSLGACLGGNGTLVGASANLTVAGLAEKNGVHFSFVKFTALAFPMMLASIAIAHVYLMWRFF
ncbi:MAG TPA: ArsB/NhaD family transporter [Rhizomicrobium sp.]|jgi:Na+/H+ antiporter NhaD/arsenite permease-like protein|nr:ArsB/NhaD family transporter [Rhizomicrobium sp.]